MVGPGVPIANENPALTTTPLLFTTTGPVVAPFGMIAVTLVFVQLVNVVAATPLKVTVLFQRLVPKLIPVIVTGVPTAPDAGEMPEIVGVAGRLNTNESTGVARIPPTNHV
jgi:hypothetical protein